MKKTNRIMAAMMAAAMLPAGSMTASAGDYDSSYDPERNLRIFDGTEEYITEHYVNPAPETEVDMSLFDDFVRYSLEIRDYDSLSEEQKELCKYVYTTERSSTASTICSRARFELQGKPVGRISLDDPDPSINITTPAPAFYSVRTDIPYIVSDIGYVDPANLNGASRIGEYWLNDEGTERVIVNNDCSYEVVKVVFTDELPEGVSESNPRVFKAADGGYIVAEPYYITEEAEYETYTSDIWVYALLPDGNAVIVDSTLPKFEEDKIDETITFPAELDGHPVVGVFQALSFTGVTRIVVPENIRCISGIKDMPYLEEIVIDSPEMSLTGGSILSCPELKKADINVKEIYAGAISECEALETLNIKGAKRISSYAFSRNLPALKNVTLPKELEAIGQGAFIGTAVKELTFTSALKLSGLIGTVPAYTYVGGEKIDSLADQNAVLIAEKDCIIKGFSNTEIERYANAHDMTFVVLDGEKGDINNDGDINIADAVVLKSFLHAKKNSILVDWNAADLNSDSSVDAYDMISMRKKILSE